MKKISNKEGILKISGFLLGLTLFTLVIHPAYCGEITLEINNPHPWAQTHGSVTVSREALGVDETETVTGLSITRVGHDWNQPFQLDDLDGNGRWDELFFQAHVDSSSSVTAVVITGPEPAEPVQFDKRVDALIDAQPRDPWVIYKPAWESEFIGYVTYGAAQIDVLGKTYQHLVLDYYYGAEPHSQHVFNADIGIDFLNLRNTMGLHAIFVREPDGSIQRPWTTNAYTVNTKIERDARFDSLVIANGPLRAIIRQWIAGWITDRGRYACEITYSMSTLKRHTDVTVEFKEFPGKKSDLQIGAGMRHMYEDIFYKKTPAYMTAVSQDVYDQGMVTRSLARAILPTSKYKTKEVPIPDDPGLKETLLNGPNYGLLFPKGQAVLKYAFVGAWEKDGGITSVIQWAEYLNRTAQEIEKPLTVRVKKN